MGTMILIDKAESFLADAKARGWNVESTRNGNKTTVLATRGENESVSVTWENNACLNECWHRLDGKNKKLRNAAAARRVLEGSTKTSSPNSKTSTPRVPLPTQTLELPSDDQPQAPIPEWGTKYVSKPDKEILAKVIGKEITWVNSRTRQLDSATVLKDPNQRQLRVEYTRARRRVITFAALGEGFRSVYVDAIVSVA